MASPANGNTVTAGPLSAGSMVGSVALTVAAVPLTSGSMVGSNAALTTASDGLGTSGKRSGEYWPIEDR